MPPTPRPHSEWIIAAGSGRAFARFLQVYFDAIELLISMIDEAFRRHQLTGARRFGHAASGGVYELRNERDDALGVRQHTASSPCRRSAPPTPRSRLYTGRWRRLSLSASSGR